MAQARNVTATGCRKGCHDADEQRDFCLLRIRFRHKRGGDFFYVIASLHLLYPVYWMCRPKSGWDVECARRLENYKPLDLPAWVGLKRAVLEHDTLRLEDAECWFAREMLASQGIADVAESNAAEKYRFLSEEPVVGRKEGHGE